MRELRGNPVGRTPWSARVPLDPLPLPKCEWPARGPAADQGVRPTQPRGARAESPPHNLQLLLPVRPYEPHDKHQETNYKIHVKSVMAAHRFAFHPCINIHSSDSADKCNRGREIGTVDGEPVYRVA